MLLRVYSEVSHEANYFTSNFFMWTLAIFQDLIEYLLAVQE